MTRPAAGHCVHGGRASHTRGLSFLAPVTRPPSPYSGVAGFCWRAGGGTVLGLGPRRRPVSASQQAKQTSMAFNDSLGKGQDHHPLPRSPGQGLSPFLLPGSVRGEASRGGASLGTETRERRPFLPARAANYDSHNASRSRGLPPSRERRPQGAGRVRGQTEVQVTVETSPPSWEPGRWPRLTPRPCRTSPRW